MKNHFYSLLMAIALVIALMLPGQAAKAAEAAPDTPVYVDGDEDVTTPGDEVIPASDEEAIPASDEAQPAPRSYGLRRDAFNGTINVLYQTPDEYGWYYIPEGTQVSFSIMPNEGFYQADHINFVVADGEIEIPNPSLTYRDENNNFQYIVPSYDNTTGWYTFTMPAYETFINAMFYPIQDTPVDPVVETETLYGIYPDAFRGTITIVEQTLNENGIYAVPEGTAVSFYVVPDEGCYLADSVIFLQEDESELAMPNPIVYYYDENGATQYIVPTYDDTTAWYTFTMPAADAFIDATFLTVEDIPDDPVISSYPINWHAAYGELTLIDYAPDEFGLYIAPEGADVSFYVMPEAGYYQADHIDFIVDGELLALPNPIVSYTDEDGIFRYIVPTFDETTCWYTFTMPDSYVFINVNFTEIEEPVLPEYFIGRVPSEGGSIEFVPENPYCSANEGSIITFEATADQGYKLDEVYILNAGTLEDGSIEGIDGSYVEFTKNEDGTYSFEMPANPVQIFAIFNKTSNSGSTGHGNGWGCGFGNGWGWGFGHNYGHGNNWGYGHGFGYGYGYGNSYGHGYGYGNSCHSLIGGIVGFLTSCNPWSLFR